MRRDNTYEETSGQYDLSAVLFATSVPVAAFAEDANTQNPVVHSEKGTSQGSNARKDPALTIRKMEERLRKVTRLRLITMSR